MNISQASLSCRSFFAALLGLLSISPTAFAQWTHKEGTPMPGGYGYVQNFTKAEWEASNFATSEQMQWFRDAKYGMFISFGLSTHDNSELSWGMCYTRKLPDQGQGPIPDAVWTKYPEELKMPKFDAKEIVETARRGGFKYIVAIVKHHDGFHLWDTKYSDFNVMHTPFGRDFLKELSDASHAAGLRFGIYFAQREWYHPDYMPVDTNKVTMHGVQWSLKPGETSPMGERHKKYIEYLFNTCRELCTNYGKIDIFWFDATWFGGMFTADMWDAERLTRMIRKLQPGIVINNRASLPGDFDTPEQQLGLFQDWRMWESCMCLTDTWSYSGTQPKSRDTIIHMILNNACGDGNVLLSLGMRWDGAFAPAEAARLVEVGDWLNANGESIYNTRGGPWKKAAWGGSTHRGDKCYLHVMNLQGEELKLPELPDHKVKSVKLLHGHALEFSQGNGSIVIHLPTSAITRPDTIIEMTMDKSVDGIKSVDVSRLAYFSDTETYGKLISPGAKVTTSSRSEADPGHPEMLVMEDAPDRFAVHTSEAETDPWIQIDLGKPWSVTGVRVVNRTDCCAERAKTLTMSVSQDGKEWQEIWHADDVKPQWIIPVTDMVAGAQVAGRKARYLRLELHTETPTPLHLRQVEIWGKPVK